MPYHFSLNFDALAFNIQTITQKHLNVNINVKFDSDISIKTSYHISKGRFTNMIADRIKELRSAMSMTQAELAKVLSLSRTAINSYEQGLSVPSVSTLVELCKFFNVSADYLLELDDSTNIRVTGLEPDEIALVYNIVEKIRSNK